MGFEEFREIVSGGRTGKNPMGFWDFVRFFLRDEREKIREFPGFGRFGGVYSASEGSYGKGDFGSLFFRVGAGKNP